MSKKGKKKSPPPREWRRGPTGPLLPEEDPWDYVRGLDKELL
jgi:hypothetical protein